MRKKKKGVAEGLIMTTEYNVHIIKLDKNQKFGEVRGHGRQ